MNLREEYDVDWDFIEDKSVLGEISSALMGADGLSIPLREHFSFQLRNFRTHYLSQIQACESPIEIKFLQALYEIAPGHGKPIAFEPYYLNTVELEGKAPPNPALYVMPQRKIKLSKEYRVDFFIVSLDHRRRCQKIVVECDGHDFHERTKEQAARDRSRDRDFTKAGYTVFRYTGSEIHKDPYKCALEVTKFADWGPK